MHDKAIFVSADIENHTIVADEIGISSELGLDVGGAFPFRSGGDGMPASKRSFRERMLLPEKLQRALRNHLHRGLIACSIFGNKPILRQLCPAKFERL
jgi:hypothetical protein